MSAELYDYEWISDASEEDATKFDVVEETIYSHSEDSSFPTTSSFLDSPSKNSPAPFILSPIAPESVATTTDFDESSKDSSIRVVSAVHPEPEPDPAPEANLNCLSQANSESFPYLGRAFPTYPTCESKVRSGVSCNDILRSSAGGPIKKRILIREGFRALTDEGAFTPCSLCAGLVRRIIVFFLGSLLSSLW